MFYFLRLFVCGIFLLSSNFCASGPEKAAPTNPTEATQSIPAASETPAVPSLAVSSLAELMDLPHSQYQRGILSNLVYTNLNRYAMTQNLSNAMQGRNFNMRVLLREEAGTPLQIDAFLFPDQSYEFSYRDLEMVAANLASELGNCFAFFNRRLDLDAIQGRILLHSVDGQLSSTHSISEFYSRFIIRRQRQALSKELVAIADQLKSKIDKEQMDAYLERSAAILSVMGWPSFSVDGPELSHSVVLIALQSGNLDFQKFALQKILDMPAEEVDLSQIAFLSDTILLSEGKQQWYGTQFTITPEDKIIPAPIEDADKVDERRAQLGMEPLTEYLELKLKQHQKAKDK